MYSSYGLNNYAEVFTSIVTAYRPANIVELGCLYGYSTVAMAKGLKENERVEGVRARIDAYDLFEDYKYRHSTLEETQKNIKDAGLEEYVTLHKEDAIRVHEKYASPSVHLLHVDLSNTGDILRDILERWDEKMVYGGIILFEGGSWERDRVEWMIKYGGRSIKYELENNQIIADKYVFGTYLKYPSLTMLLKKR